MRTIRLEKRMRNSIKLSGLAILALLAAAGVASAQTVIQPQYQPGAGSGQSFLYHPGPTSQPAPSPRQGSTQGPVTGYGAGGLMHAPGTPVDPPYFRGATGGNGR
jgi:hypothetical protein